MSIVSPNQRIGFDTERSVTGPFTGIFQVIGTPLAVNPVLVVLDNQSTVTVQISVDGENVWKTFETEEALVLDLVTNGGVIDKNVQFYAKATAGTGTFYISIIYDR